jgi:hypothetical protein
MYKFIIKTFDQLKNDNFDQVKFDQVIIPQNCNYAMFQFSYYLYAKLLTFKIFNKKNQLEILKMKINKPQLKL